MEFLSLPLLIFAPLICSIVLFTPLFAGNEVYIRRFAKIFATIHFFYSLCFLIFFQNSEAIQFANEITSFGTSWIPALGIKCEFGLNGLSLLMVILTSCIFMISIIASKIIIRTKHNFYYALMFLLESSILGIFCANDMFLFFLFWELELIPMYFLIGQWGDAKAKQSALKYVLYTFLGSLFMLIGILMIHYFNFNLTEIFSADFKSIVINESNIPLNIQVLISILLLIGFGVKLPIIPLHTWLPDVHTDAPTPVSMILAGVLLKLGAYGILKFNILLLPIAFSYIAPWLIILALINVIYSAFVAFAQKDLKRLVAYSSISHMGIILMGLSAMSLFSLCGAVFHMFAHGFISAGLFAIVGIIYLRTKTREISQLGGLGTCMPRLMGFSLIIVAAAVGIPFLIGFVGEFLTFFGTFVSPIEFIIPIWFFAVFTTFVLILAAAYILKFLHRTFFSVVSERWTDLKDITNTEFVVLFTISFCVVIFGLYPMAILQIIQPTLNAILESAGL